MRADGGSLGPEDAGLSALKPGASQANGGVGLPLAQKLWCRPISHSASDAEGLAGVSQSGYLAQQV